MKDLRRLLEALLLLVVSKAIQWRDGQPMVDVLVVRFPTPETQQPAITGNNERNPYQKPEIIRELNLEARAGSPNPCPDEITGIPCP